MKKKYILLLIIAFFLFCSSVAVGQNSAGTGDLVISPTKPVTTNNNDTTIHITNTPTPTKIEIVNTPTSTPKPLPMPTKRLENTYPTPTKKIEPTKNPTPTKVYIQPTHYVYPIIFPTIINTSRAFQEQVLENQRLAFDKVKMQRILYEKQKLLITDKKKIEVVTKIDTTVSQLNRTQTANMVSALDQMQTVLLKINTRGMELSKLNVDISKLIQRILEAQSMINNAKTFVLSQSKKEYVATISGEVNLKNDMGVIVKQFQTDIGPVRESVLIAKKSVLIAAEELNLLYKSIKPTPTIIIPGN